MKCPRDATALEAKKYEADIEVDLCPTCRGIWLDKGELESIQEIRERDYTEQLAREPDRGAAAYAQARTADATPIACPKCGGEMELREYAYCSQVMVDVCTESCGMWLDRGEIERLEIFFERNKKEANEADESRSDLWSTLVSLFAR